MHGTYTMPWAQCTLTIGCDFCSSTKSWHSLYLGSQDTNDPGPMNCAPSIGGTYIELPVYILRHQYRRCECSYHCNSGARNKKCPMKFRAFKLFNSKLHDHVCNLNILLESILKWWQQHSFWPMHIKNKELNMTKMYSCMLPSIL